MASEARAHLLYIASCFSRQSMPTIAATCATDAAIVATGGDHESAQSFRTVRSPA
jgi:hypothetical protein